MNKAYNSHLQSLSRFDKRWFNYYFIIGPTLVTTKSKTPSPTLVPLFARYHEFVKLHHLKFYDSSIFPDDVFVQWCISYWWMNKLSFLVLLKTRPRSILPTTYVVRSNVMELLQTSGHQLELHSVERITPPGWTVYILYPTNRPDL